MHQLQTTNKFDKQIERLLKKNPRLKKDIGTILNLLITDPHHSSLKLHKLTGKNNWSVRVTPDIRIILH